MGSPGVQNKLKLAYLFLVSILLLVLVVLLTYRFLSMPPEQDTSVSGFGDTATNDLYANMTLSFLNSPCDAILGDEELIANAALQNNFKTLAGENLAISTYVPLNCRYDVGDGKYIDFIVHTYDGNSKIDDTREDLFARVNAQITKPVNQGRVGIIDFFSGNDNQVDGCRTNLFHPLNDFEFADIVYYGFDCDKISDINNDLVKVFGNYLVSTVEHVYLNYGNTDTANLLEEYGYADLIPALNLYN